MFRSLRFVSTQFRLPAFSTKSTLDIQSAGEKVLIADEDLVGFATNVLQSAGASRAHAELHAEVLVTADRWGHPSHGLNRLEMYVDELSRSVVDGNALPTVDSQTAAVAVVNGQNTLGSMVGKYAMELAIAKAREVGVGWVVAHQSNHYGVAGFYTQLAVNEGMLGLSFTNTSPLVVPTGARKAALGTDALACAMDTSASDGRRDKFMIDCATSTVAIGKVEVMHRKGERVPLGWGVDKSGAPTTDPLAILNGGGLSPLGGSIETAGYKGYGLAMMVEIFCGVLSGSLTSPAIGPWRAGRTTRANMGHCFVAIDPRHFAPGYEARLTDLLHRVRSLPLAEGSAEILIPGDREFRLQEAARRDGVTLLRRVYDALVTLGQQYKVAAPAVRSGSIA